MNTNDRQPNSDDDRREPLDALLARARWPELTGESLRRMKAHFRRLRRAKQRAWRWPAAAAAVVVIAVGAYLLVRSGPAKPSPPPRARTTEIDAARLRAEIDRLRAKADAHQLTVDRLLAMERKARAEAALRGISPSPTAAERIERHVNETALVIVHDADQIRAQKDGRAQAIEEYRLVITLFPQTPSANVARRRLAEIEKL